MTKMDIRFDVNFPKEYKSLSGNAEVKGIFANITNAKAFAYGNFRSLHLVLEPNNLYDNNAIMVYGSFSDSYNVPKFVHLGYVDAHTARYIYEIGFQHFVRAELKNIWWGGYRRDVIYIRMWLIVPKKKTDVTNLPKNKYYHQLTHETFDFQHLRFPLNLSTTSQIGEGLLYYSCLALYQLYCMVAFCFSWIGPIIDDIIHYDERRPSFVRFFASVVGLTLFAFCVILLFIKVVLHK